MMNGLLGGGVMGEAINLFREMEENASPPDSCICNLMTEDSSLIK